MHLDYTELTKPVSLVERLKYLREKPLYSQITVGLLVLVDLVFLVIFFVSLPTLMSSVAGGDREGARLFFVTGIAGVVGIVMPLMLIRAVGNELREKRFAAANNMTFYSGAMNEERNGLIFHYGDTRRFSMLFTPSKGYIKEFGTYCYDISSGRNRTTHYYGFVRIKLSRRLPNMVLDSHENNIFGESGLPENFSKSQVLHLEGDFDKYFTLYAPQQYEQDALYIFTPDVMQTMVDASHRYDSEIVDDDFYLYTRKIDISNVSAIEALMTVADTIAKQLDVQAERYADERVGDSTLNVVARPGIRLKRSSRWGLIVVLAIIVFIINYLISVAANQ